MYWNNYHLPKSLDEAISLLVHYQSTGRIVAGGTDLIPQLMNNNDTIESLIDISRLSELKQIKTDEENICIGALCTHSQIANSTIIQTEAAALATASALVGSPQIRSVGTLGGNVVNAYSGADAAIALAALDAKALILSDKGDKCLPLSDLYSPTGQSKVDPAKEILTEFLIPRKTKHTASSFKRLARRKAMAKPTINTAVTITLAEDHETFKSVRIAVGPVAAVPWRAAAAESLLVDAPVQSELINNAAQQAAAQSGPRYSVDGDADYRREMVKVLVNRAIKDALEQLGGIVID